MRSILPAARPEPAPRAPLALVARSVQEMVDDLKSVRRQYLEALPVAGAVLDYVDGAVSIDCCNAAYAALETGGDMFGLYPENPPAPLLDRCGFIDRIAEFMASDDAMRELEWSDGGPVVGRHYVIRLARVPAIDSGEPRCLLTLLDKTAELQAEKSLRLEMFNDSLTGLPNRAGFSEALEQAGAAGDNHFAVLIVDLMRFSRINESIGSLAGDELLITVARRLMSALRTGDVIARTGGDEFGLLIRLVDGPGDALHIAQRINAIFAQPCRLSDLEIRIEPAIGCALSEPDCDGEALVRRAQFAIKRAKISGKVEVYQPVAFNQARRRFSLETALRRAIEGDRLRLAFQPLIDLSSGRIAGYEALARWTDGDRGEVSPSDFIPVAEESGLIVPLGRWALDTAARTLASWDKAVGETLPIHVAVNISAIQIARDDVAGAVSAALADHGLAGKRLMLELTESAIIADPDRATRVMESLKALNTPLAMDDFGTGYSNLAYLQRLPIDMLKIDRSFITGMLADKDKVAIVRAILSLAHALGISTTAEGIESIQLAQTLSALGCTRGQGYYYGVGMPADEALAYWRSRDA